jgi:hypothetical protein
VTRGFNIVAVIILKDDTIGTSSPSQNIKGKRKVENSSKSLEIRARKPKQTNWVNSEIKALINAKKAEHEASLDVVVDSQDNMETSVTKWKLSTNLLSWPQKIALLKQVSSGRQGS